MKRILMTTFSAAVLVACSPQIQSETAPEPQLDAAAKQEAVDAWRERRLAHGKEVYLKACAECHDGGVGGAPAIGDRQAWSERSPFWSAVLFEHSRSGWLNMPPRGAHPELSDQDVDAAGEYLLSTTFPDLPVD